MRKISPKKEYKSPVTLEKILSTQIMKKKNREH